MILRKLSEAANHKENTMIGARAAIPTPIPSRLEALLNRCSADADKASVLCALSAAGFDRVGCYFGDSLTSISGVAEVVRLHATSSDPASAAE